MTEAIWASLEMFWLKKMTPPTSPSAIQRSRLAGGVSPG
jgi:hypothetical protein